MTLRCIICNWPLAESREKGCVPGDCSYRPDDPAEQARIRERRQNWQRSAGVHRRPPMTDESELIRSAFLRNLQFENKCSETGKPCHDKCGCAIEVQEWIDEERSAVSTPGESS
jgi:hypothetical protein